MRISSGTMHFRIDPDVERAEAEMCQFKPRSKPEGHSGGAEYRCTEQPKAVQDLAHGRPFRIDAAIIAASATEKNTIQNTASKVVMLSS